MLFLHHDLEIAFKTRQHETLINSSAPVQRHEKDRIQSKSTSGEMLSNSIRPTIVNFGFRNEGFPLNHTEVKQRRGRLLLKLQSYTLPLQSPFSADNKQEFSPVPLNHTTNTRLTTCMP